MSLLGNRGRFSDDNLKSKLLNAELKSDLSLIGKNPRSIIDISFDENEVKETVKDKIAKEDLTKYHSKINSRHEEYNTKLNSFNENKEKSFNIRTKKGNFEFKKQKTSIKTIVAMFIVEAFAIVGILAYAQLHRLTQMTQNVAFDPKAVVNNEIDASTINIMKGYKTIAVFGVDSRNGSIAQGNNADVNLIINLNVENGDVELVSLYRDLYLSVTDNNSYDKLNSAYSRGGPEGAVKAINKNFDLNITNFFAFNWKAVADGIFLLGGIDIEITKAEFKYMNAFIHETCIATGIDAKNPAAHYIKSTGMQHLDGVQAVAYGRLRLMDSDFKRVERQKAVIAECLKKAKTMDLATLRVILEAVLPQIAYEFDMNEMLSLLRIVRSVNIVESAGCPEVSNVVSMEMGAAGSCVVPLNLEKAVVKLHKMLFNEDDYTVSASVRRYSNRITELRHKYQAENEEKESIKQSLEQESLLGNVDTSSRPKISSKSNTTPTNRLSSSSNANKQRSTSSNTNRSNDISTIDVAVYADEPENDNETTETTRTQNNNTAVVLDGPSGAVAPSDNSIINQNAPIETSAVSSGLPNVVNIAPGETITQSNQNTTPQDFAPQNIVPQNAGVQNNAPVAAETIVEPIIVIP